MPPPASTDGTPDYDAHRRAERKSPHKAMSASSRPNRGKNRVPTGRPMGTHPLVGALESMQQVQACDGEIGHDRTSTQEVAHRMQGAVEDAIRHLWSLHALVGAGAYTPLAE